MARTKLNDEHWHKLFIILRQINIYNKPNLRRTVEGMLYRIRVGCPWRDLPSFLVICSGIFIQTGFWVKTGNWKRPLKISPPTFDGDCFFLKGGLVKPLRLITGPPVLLVRPFGKSVQVITTNFPLVVVLCGTLILFGRSGGKVLNFKVKDVVIDHELNQDTNGVFRQGG